MNKAQDAPAATADALYDVAIIGGGPGGTTLGSLLRKYDPTQRVVIFEKEKFPRDHIGESQLPPISDVLDEMGCWDKVEAANFPIKVGATFRWGRKSELWDFEFLPLKDFKDEPRPAKYAGQRRQTAFQVDRSIYDDILLRHAEELGCEVREQTQVAEVLREGDRVTGIRTRDGKVTTARRYVDASGHVGILRRAMGVEIDVPTALQNIAVWDYWNNAEWAVKIGVGGTRIQVMSVSFGWIWFIPLGPERTSLGLVCPAEYYKACGKSAHDLYHEAIRSEPRIAALITNATCRGCTETTKDWSFVAERTFGDNWFLVGEAAGFADPILSAGLTLTHTGARELAYTILALDEKEHDPDWLCFHYDQTQRKRVGQHIRFADFWYASNGQLSELQDHCKKIAQDAGLRLSPQSAWRWIAQGGFSNDVLGQVGIGGYDVAAAKQVTQLFTNKPVDWQINQFNVFKLNLVGAEENYVPIYVHGKIVKTPCYARGVNTLPLTGMFDVLVNILHKASNIAAIHQLLQAYFVANMPAHAHVAMHHAFQCMEVMLNEGWIVGKLDKKKPRVTLATPNEGLIVHLNRDPEIQPAPN